MKNIIKLLPLFGIVALSGCGTTYQVKKADEAISGEGVYYYLPRNMVKLNLGVKKSTTKKGRYFSQKDACFLPNDRSDAHSGGKKTTYKITSSTFELLAKKDDNHQYFVDLSTSANPFSSKGGSFTFGDEQVLNGATAKSTNTSYDFVIGLATAAAKGFAAAGRADKDLLGVDSTCTADARIARQGIAELESKLIDIHKESRGTLSPELYKSISASLNARISTLKGYFFGESSIRKYNVIVYLEPGNDWKDNTRQQIKLFDASLKHESYLKQIAKNTYLVDVKNLSSQKNKNGIYLAIGIKRNVQGTYSSGKGFAYRLPGKGDFAVEKWKNDKLESTIGTTSKSIAQFGSVQSLPNRFGWINSEVTEFALDPLTGALKKLSVNGSGLSTEQAGALTGAIAAKNAPEPAATDTTLADLEKQRDILKVQQEIAILEAGGQLQE